MSFRCCHLPSYVAVGEVEELIVALELEDEQGLKGTVTLVEKVYFYSVNNSRYLQEFAGFYRIDFMRVK